MQTDLSNQRSNCQHSLDHRESKGIPEKNISICFIEYAKDFHCVDHNKLWKTLKEMGVPDHLIFLLTSLYVGQKAAVRIRHGTLKDLKLGQEHDKVYTVTLVIEFVCRKDHSIGWTA